MYIKSTRFLLIVLTSISFCAGWFLNGMGSSAQDQKLLSETHLQLPEAQLQRPGDSIEEQLTLPEAKSGIGVIGNMAFVVHKVNSGSPAEQLGLRTGDLITRWNGKQVISIKDFLLMGELNPGQIVEIEFLRADFDSRRYQVLKGRTATAAINLQPKSN
jgi:S1-C subfamily serine protease